MLRRIVFAVLAREYRNDDFRAFDRLLRLQRLRARIFRRRDLALILIDTHRIDGFIAFAPCADRGIDGYFLLIENDIFFFCGDAQQRERIIQDAFAGFHDDAARHQVIEGKLAAAGSADMIAEAHLADGFRHAAEFHRRRRHDRALADQLAHLVKVLLQLIIIRRVIRMRMMRDHIDIIAGFLEFRGNDLIALGRGHRERDQRRRDMELIERPAHGVLAADRRSLKGQLRLDQAEQCLHRLAPFLRIFMQPLKVFLVAQPACAVIAAHGAHARQCLYDRIRRAQIRGETRDIRIVAMRHDRASVREAEYRQLLHAALGLGQLILAAKGHQDRRLADGSVKHLGHADLACHIRLAQVIQDVGSDRHERIMIGLARGDLHVLYTAHAVSI